MILGDTKDIYLGMDQTSLIQQKYNNEMLDIRRMGRYMVPRVKDNNPISKKSVNKGRQGNFKISKLISLN